MALVLVTERKGRGWSQAELARRARIVAPQLSMIEAGRYRPYPRQLKRLARALQWPVEQAERLLDEAESVTRS